MYIFIENGIALTPINCNQAAQVDTCFDFLVTAWSIVQVITDKYAAVQYNESSSVNLQNKWCVSESIWARVGLNEMIDGIRNISSNSANRFSNNVIMEADWLIDRVIDRVIDRLIDS